MALIKSFPQLRSSPFNSPPATVAVPIRFSVFRCSVASPVAFGRPDDNIRLGLPSKGRMATDTLELLKDCQLSVKQVNPRQYVAEIPQKLKNIC